jgi:hypothetical protein
MSTITATSTTAGASPVADQRVTAREQAALSRLTAAVVTLRTWRQLAPPPIYPPADQGARHDTGRER